MMKILQLQIDASQPIHQLTSPPPLLKSEDGKGASPIIWNEADLLEFAEGRVSQVFGKDYEIVDTYTRRVRLPMPPYLLVSRVTQLKGEKGGFKPSSITTEYDIPHNAWYSVDGQIPWAVAVESGQCDLLLISYLGIDFENQGHLVYRLLDCTLTFLDDLPREGETLRYHISIHSFARNGDNLLFFFSYECFVGEKMVLKMDDGCAGFFSDQQLEQGKGIIETDRQLTQRYQIQKREFEPLLICQKSTFDPSDLLHLTNGNIAACFGDHYDQYGLNPSLRLPPNAIRMIDRVISVDPTGGDWGLGFVIGEKTIAPDDWYFPCHFKDDPVMAGSLMAEGCGQLLQFYLLYLGLQTYTSDARFQPIPGLRQVVRCRGQVTPIAATLIYRMEVTEIGLSPNPYAKCNVDIILKDDQNNKTIVRFQDLGLQLSEKHPPKAPSIEHRQEKSMTGFAMNRLIQNHQTLNQKSALLSKEQIREFCTGSVSKCFGSEFEIYDRGIIKASRMPNTHLNLMHRVMDVRGKRHEITKHSTIVTEYDTPIDPWYYRQNASLTLPYSILMEIALQPCGFLSAYLGTTLLYRDRDLYFRNLDGKGHLLKTVDIRGKTVTNTARLLSSSTIEGVIIQSFDFQVSSDGEIFYQGAATFGHFGSEALVNQVGLDRGQMIFPWYETEKTTGIQIDLRSRENRNKFYGINKHQPNYHLANHQLDLLNQVKIVAGGGHYHQGYIYATKTVKPTDWYFKCHFFQDPVMPGSLGVEAILQAMQVYALQFDFGKHFKSPRFQSLINHQTVWKYRGQIPHIQTEMSLEVHLSKIEITPTNVILMGDASVWRENLRIYDVQDVAICLVES